jgi:ribosome-binding factor A
MTRRTARVADAIRSTVAELLLKEIKDPRIGMITVTAVRVSPDLRHARVFFSVLGDADQRRRSLAGLESATGFLRSRLGRELQLRVVPEIVFEFDPSLAEAERVSQLLRDVPTDEEP